MSLEWAWLRDTGVRHANIAQIELRRQGPCAVLLLHGLTGGPTELAYIAHNLHYRSRMTVSCPPLANHGQPVAVLARTTWRQLWDSARDHLLAAHASAERDGLPLFVGGLSIGALLSLMLAAEFPDKVAGVACLSPTLFYDGWNVPWYQRFLPLADHTPFKSFLFLREGEPYGLKDEALRARMREKYRAARLDDCSAPPATYAHFPVRLLCECRHLIAQGKRMLPAVRAPVLVIQARDDDSTSPANARYILERVASRRKRLVLLENSYHIVTADLEREKVAEEMARFFLEACERRPAAAGQPVPA